MTTRTRKQAHGRHLGYARVSTEDQSLARQLAALETAGCTEIWREHVSGGSLARPELKRLVAQAGQGDVVVVASLDRLARSLRDLLRIVGVLTRRGVGLRVLDQPIDTTTPQGQFALQVLGAAAEFERAMVRERTRGGLAAARRAGRIGGNPGLRRRDPAALAAVAAAREAKLTERAIQAAGPLLPLVRQLRPGLPWDKVATLLGRRGLRRPWDGRPWTRDSLRRVVERLVREGLVYRELLDPAPRRGNEIVAGIVRAVAATMPEAGPTAVARQLEAIRQPTARGRMRWSASSVRAVLEGGGESR